MPSIAIAASEPVVAAPSPLAMAEDPPARVGRIARMSGAVTIGHPDRHDAIDAVTNYPVRAGDLLRVDHQGSVTVEIGDTVLTLAEDSELLFTGLGGPGASMSLARGALELWLRNPAPDGSAAVATPRMMIAPTRRGHYAISAGDAEHATRVAVIDGIVTLGGSAPGAAGVAPSGMTLDIGAGQVAILTGGDAVRMTVEPISLDGQAAVARGAPLPPAPPSARGMTGGGALAEAGVWSERPKDGPIWYPPVATGWVPFREGRWMWVAPWGWTWIDSADWGFVTSHYGRWIEMDGRWGWSPGASDPVSGIAPIYGPANVAWLTPPAGLLRSEVCGGSAESADDGNGKTGSKGGAAASAIGGNGVVDRLVAWRPLALRTAYVPPYAASDAYVSAINATVGATDDHATPAAVRTLKDLTEPKGVTFVPAAAFGSAVTIAPVAAETRAALTASCVNAAGIAATSATSSQAIKLAGKDHGTAAGPTRDRRPAGAKDLAPAGPREPRLSAAPPPHPLPTALPLAIPGMPLAPSGDGPTAATASAAALAIPPAARGFPLPPLHATRTGPMQGSTVAPIVPQPIIPAGGGDATSGVDGTSAAAAAAAMLTTRMPSNPAASAGAAGAVMRSMLQGAGGGGGSAVPVSAAPSIDPGADPDGGGGNQSLLSTLLDVVQGIAANYVHQTELNVLLMFTLAVRIIAFTGMFRTFRRIFNLITALGFMVLMVGGEQLSALERTLSDGPIADVRALLKDNPAPLFALLFAVIALAGVLWAYHRKRSRDLGRTPEMRAMLYGDAAQDDAA